jgi:hypothetical protein
LPLTDDEATAATCMACGCALRGAVAGLAVLAVIFFGNPFAPQEEKKPFGTPNHR